MNPPPKAARLVAGLARVWLVLLPLGFPLCVQGQDAPPRSHATASPLVVDFHQTGGVPLDSIGIVGVHLTLEGRVNGQRVSLVLSENGSLGRLTLPAGRTVVELDF